VTSWDKRACFRKQKMLISGFGRGYPRRVNFWVLLGNVLCVLGKNVALTPRFEPISVHFFAHNHSLCMINQ